MEISNVELDRIFSKILSKNLIRNFKYFRTVYKTGNLREAAHLEGKTRSNISMAITSLEKIIGFKLFDRSRKIFHATELGERLYMYSYNLSFFNKDCIGGDIRINFIRVTCHPLILDEIFRAKYNELDNKIFARISIEDRENAVEQFKSNDTDLIIYPMEQGMIYDLLSVDEYEVVELRRYEMVLVVHKDNPLANVAPWELSLLKMRDVNLMPDNDKINFESWNVNKVKLQPFKYFENKNLLFSLRSFNLYETLCLISRNFGTMACGKEIIDNYIKGNSGFKKKLKIIDGKKIMDNIKWVVIYRKKTKTVYGKFIEKIVEKLKAKDV